MRPSKSALFALSLIAPLALSTPALARAQDKQDKTADAKTERPITDRQPDAADVATTPLGDLNLRKQQIPPLLIAAQANPYDAQGMTRCPAIAAAVTDLDRILGDDVDLPQKQPERLSAGKIAQSLVGKFIPFRSVIRELSGANAHERRVDDAIEAGVARRAFLKGLGQAKGCQYPARAATPQAIAAHELNPVARYGMEPATHAKTVEPIRPASEREAIAAAYAKAEAERQEAEKARQQRAPQR